MATPISTNPSVYFTNFETGNDFTPSTYFQYARDMDDNFKSLRTTVNQLVAEVNAVNGPSSLIAQDIIFVNDPAGGPGVINTGVIGAHSYGVTINGGNNALLDVAIGSAIVPGNQRVTLAAAVQLDGTPLGGATTAYVAIDANGAVSLESAASQQQLDIVSAVWNGTIFTSVTQLAYIFFDGDEWYAVRDRPANGAWTSKTFDSVGVRIEAVERAITGISTDSEGTAVSGLGFSGSAAAPGIVITDGTTRDNTGLYRVAADSMGISVAGTQRARWTAQGLIFNQDGSAGAPIITDTSDLDKGIYFTGTGTAISMDGVVAFEVVAGQTQHPVGAVGTPGMGFIGDTDTGVYRPAANEIGLTTGGTLAWRADGNQQVHAPANFRCRVFQDAFNIANDTLVNIEHDNEDFDIGGMHDNVTNPDRITIPTGGDGVYMLWAHCRPVESTSTGTPNSGNDRTLLFTVNGAAGNLGRLRQGPPLDTNTHMTISDIVSLTAGDIVRIQVLQDSGGTMDVDSEMAVVRLW